MALGGLAVAALPLGVVLAERLESVRLIHAALAIPAAAVIGLLAIGLARGARFRVQMTVGRASGARLAAVGRVLGGLGVYLAVTAALAVAFYALLEYFADA